MILTCPACRTRYLVDAAALGTDAERRVRCASCGNLWQYSPEGAAIHAAVAEVTAAAASASGTAPAPGVPTLRAEPGTQLSNYPSGPTARGRPSVVTESPAAGRRRGATIGVVGAVMLAALLVIVAIAARGRIAAMWPAAGPALEKLHLAEPPGQGLAISSVVRRTADSLIVAGDIVNKTTVPQPVPRLRLTLRDGSRGDLATKVVDPPVDRLTPGASAHFTAEFEHPSITATGVAVEFAAN